MRIGLNLLYLIPGKVGGTETYARELIPYLAQDNQLILFCTKETAPTFQSIKNIQVITLPIYARNRFARILVEQLILPWISPIHKIDLLFSLGYSAPIIHFCPSVVTIHDLNWYYHPEDFTYLNRFMWEVITRASAYFSDHVITDSVSSADSLAKVLHLPYSKITSILHATPHVLKVVSNPQSHPYIFTVLANYPHKNISTLLSAFKQLTGQFKDLDLVVCGLGKQATSSKRVKYLGYVNREELATLYAGAAVFVFPSAYEGFGYPVFEAMSYQVPVVSSNAYSIAEVVGDGGILVNPHDTAAYVQAISDILSSPKLRKELIVRGTKRASELKWDRTAASTLAILRKVATR